MVGRRVMFTPKGFLVMLLHFRISFRRSSGVGWVRAVSWIECQCLCLGDCRDELGLTIPRPPAFETALASSAYPTHCIPP